jgi:hypothetical protein
MSMSAKEVNKNTAGKVCVLCLCVRFPYLANNYHDLTFYCLSPWLSTHKSDPAPPVDSDRSQELNEKYNGGMSMNSEKLEKKNIVATVCVLRTYAFAQMITIS